MQGIGFGDVGKILFKFDEPFWQLGNRRVLSFSFIWNDEERSMIEADVSKLMFEYKFMHSKVNHSEGAGIKLNKLISKFCRVKNVKFSTFF